MRVYIEGVEVLGPGLANWAEAQAVLRGAQPYISAPTVLSASDLLPAAERRRTGVPVKLALAVGSGAFRHAQRDPGQTASVFTSSGGDGDNVHQICETLAVAAAEVSPTRFHNSVHNAAAGYWSIATGAQQASTSICAHDMSFVAGLVEAATQAVVGHCTVGLIAYDHAYPEPLHTVRPIGGHFAVALVLSAVQTAQAIASLDLEILSAGIAPSVMAQAELENLRKTIPAARALPLLQVLARESSETVGFKYMADSVVGVRVSPCA